MAKIRKGERKRLDLFKKKTLETKRNPLNYDNDKSDDDFIRSNIEIQEENPLTGSLGLPTNLLPKFLKYEGVKSGTFISLAGSASRSGALFTCR